MLQLRFEAEQYFCEPCILPTPSRDWPVVHPETCYPGQPPWAGQHRKEAWRELRGFTYGLTARTVTLVGLLQRQNRVAWTQFGTLNSGNVVRANNKAQQNTFICTDQQGC